MGAPPGQKVHLTPERSRADRTTNGSFRPQERGRRNSCQKKSPAAVVCGGTLPLAVARFPQGDVGGAVFGRVVELDQPAA